jgi:acetyl-CoA C-acetyltransferase
VVTDDEQPRPETSEQAGPTAPGVSSGNGTVTAGNASSLNDGAAAVMLMSVDKAHELITGAGRIVSSRSPGSIPSVMGIGPVSAATRAQRSGLDAGRGGSDRS